MGRGVMTRHDALITVFAHWADNHTSICQYCELEVKHEYQGWVVAYGTKKGSEVCYVDEYGDDVAHIGWDYDSDDFENDVEYYAQWMKELWPSLYDVDRWFDNETRIFLANELVEISIAEYCGMVALSVAPVTDSYGDAINIGLAAQWARQIEPKFREYFGELTKIGTFSNGESVYERSA